MRTMKRYFALMMMLLILGTVPVSAATNTSTSPVLKITDVSESVVESNTAYELSITIENMGSAFGEDLSIYLVPEEDAPIILTEQISAKTVRYLNPGTPFEVTYGIRVESGADPGFYDMTLLGTMLNNDGNEVDYEETFSIEVVRGNHDVDFEITAAEGSIFQQDTEVKAQFILENQGAGDASDVTIKFADNDEAGIYATGDVSKFLATVGGHKAMNFQMDLVIDAQASGYTPLAFEVSYDTGISRVTETVNTYINIESDGDASVIIKGITKSRSSIVPDQQVTFNVVVENTGEVEADYVTLSVSQDEAVVPSSQSVYVIDSIPAGEQKSLDFTLEATDSAVTQNYPIEFILEYEEESYSQYSGVYVTNDEDDEEDVVSQPRIVVQNFNISDDKIFVGDTFDISFDVTNTSDLKDIRNLKVVIGTTAGSDGEEAFMPLNQSSSYFVGNLAMGESSVIEMPMKVFANAEGKSYSMSIEFEYEDLDGVLYEDNETISIPVYEKTELTVSDVSVGSRLDNGYTLQVDFYNTGKVDITNMMVDLEGDFRASNSNYYVGDFATGRTDVYDVEILGSAPEVIEGSIIFTYDDTFGEEETYVKEFSIDNSTASAQGSGLASRTMSTDGSTVNAGERSQMVKLTEEQQEAIANMSSEERMAYMQSLENGSSASSDMILYIAAGAVVVILGIVATVLVRRKRKAD